MVKTIFAYLFVVGNVIWVFHISTESCGKLYQSPVFAVNKRCESRGFLHNVWETLWKRLCLNIDREIIKAYRAALKYAQDRISDYCAARGASYICVSALDSFGTVFFGKLIDIGVLK